MARNSLTTLARGEIQRRFIPGQDSKQFLTLILRVTFKINKRKGIVAIIKVFLCLLTRLFATLTNFLRMLILRILENNDSWSFEDDC